MKKLCALVLASASMLLASWVEAASISFFATRLNNATWRYDYVIKNDSLAVGIEEFEILFPPALYSNLVAKPTPGWDVGVVQPSKTLPDDGVYSGLAIGLGGISPGASASGFYVEFDYLGTGTPGAQAFEILDPRTSQLLTSGQTAAAPDMGQKIAALYVAFFQRAPDLDGLVFWKTVALSSGLSDAALMRQMAGGFANHPSFAAIYGALANGAYVDAIYLNIGGKPADAAGKAYWLGLINSGQISRSDFVADFVFGLLEITDATLQQLVASGAITAAERQDALDRKYQMLNKTEVALAFVDSLGRATNLSPATNPLDPASLAADPAYQASQNIIGSVTEEPASKMPPLNYLTGTPTISGINSAFPPAPVAKVTIGMASASIQIGEKMTASASLTAANGQGLINRLVTWSTTSPHIATVSASGLITGISTGQTEVIAVSEGKQGSAQVTITPSPQSVDAGLELLDDMLAMLPSFITYSISYNESLIPRNPNLAALLTDRIALLSSPGLAADIETNEYFASTAVMSINGRLLPLATIFPADWMREEAVRTLGMLAMPLRTMEEFFGVAYPAASVKLWYGFQLGNSGGAGTVRMEDQTTYESRTATNRLPYEAILYHEVSHSYISHESLNQFLELYIYNLAKTKSTDLVGWTYTRNYTPGLPSNAGIHALLDVYAILGREAMIRAYRTIYPLFPPYGVALSEQCKEAFVNEAPSESKAQVRLLMSRVTN